MVRMCFLLNKLYLKKLASLSGIQEIWSVQSFCKTCLPYNQTWYEVFIKNVNVKLQYSSHLEDIQSQFFLVSTVSIKSMRRRGVKSSSSPLQPYHWNKKWVMRWEAKQACAYIILQHCWWEYVFNFTIFTFLLTFLLLLFNEHDT